MAKFFLRTKQKTGTAKLYIRICRQSLGINWWVCSGISVNVEQWNKAQKNVNSLSKYYSSDEGAKVQEKMNVICGIISELFENGAIRCAEDKDIIDDAIKKVNDAEARKVQEEIRNYEREEEEKRLRRICDYYDYFVGGIENGTILKKRGDAYRGGSVRVWKDFGRYLKAYTPETMIFDEISKSFADGFVVYLKRLGLMPKTINKLVLCFRALCNSAAVNEKNANLISVKVWSEKTVRDNEKRAEIALSDTEIDSLYDMPLTGIREQVRDIWCLGFFSGQRVSDYSSFTRDNFKVTESGVPVIVLDQVKTGNEVVVPILDNRVSELCRKYDYNFPKVDRRQINRYIKEVLRELSKSVPSLGEWVRTPISLAEAKKEKRYMEMNKRIASGEILHGEERKVYAEMKEYATTHESGKMLYKRDYAGHVIRQRWEMISTHSSRRSCITSLYNSGLFDTRELMSISGHQTIQVFENYIKRGKIEQAERIAEKARKAKEIKMRRKEA